MQSLMVSFRSPFCDGLSFNDTGTDGAVLMVSVLIGTRVLRKRLQFWAMQLSRRSFSNILIVFVCSWTLGDSLRCTKMVIDSTLSLRALTQSINPHLCVLRLPLPVMLLPTTCCVGTLNFSSCGCRTGAV